RNAASNRCAPRLFARRRVPHENGKNPLAGSLYPVSTQLLYRTLDPANCRSKKAAKSGNRASKKPARTGNARLGSHSQRVQSLLLPHESRHHRQTDFPNIVLATLHRSRAFSKTGGHRWKTGASAPQPRVRVGLSSQKAG